MVLPKDFQEFLLKLNEQKVFITSWDLRTIRIYPICVWKQNEILFDNAGDDAEDLEDLQHLTNKWGDDSPVDQSGRILIPQKLRREMKIENQTVSLECQKSVFLLYTQDESSKRDERANQNLPDKVKKAKGRGLR